MECNVKIMKYFILQKEHKIISEILYDKQDFINKYENVLLFNKDECLKMLNTIIIKLNNHYKISLNEIINNKIQKKN